MARLVVVADAETGLGFRLAGVEVFAVEDAETAADRLRALLADPSVGLVAVAETFYRRLDVVTLRQIETSYRPVVVPAPTGGPTDSFATRREYLSALIERAIGFHMTFPGEEESP